jgi:hypothetical protein
MYSIYHYTGIIYLSSPLLFFVYKYVNGAHACERFVICWVCTDFYSDTTVHWAVSWCWSPALCGPDLCWSPLFGDPSSWTLGWTFPGDDHPTGRTGTARMLGDTGHSTTHLLPCNALSTFKRTFTQLVSLSLSTPTAPQYSIKPLTNNHACTYCQIRVKKWKISLLWRFFFMVKHATSMKSTDSWNKRCTSVTQPSDLKLQRIFFLTEELLILWNAI